MDQPHQRPEHQELPQHAKERLAEMRQNKFFTSDLSVNEFLLVKEAGFQPLGLVMGSSIYHIGIQQMRGIPEELTMLTQALYGARELAMVRMEEEADELGADGIVAVRLALNIHAWGANVIEFLAIGTAVKSDKPGFRGAENRPFTSDLSGQDFWTLLNAGYRPVGFVMGNCVYHVGQGPSSQPTQNAELTEITQALYDARELAMERMQVEAEAMNAAGIVGVTIDENNHTWGPAILEFSAVGTAVVPIRDDHHIPKPTLVLSVGD
ncbi:MAG: heavy metal-binding domain-containing protein [Kofleriaceae bacterium]